MQERNNEDLYNPIYLNHIFNDDDILDEWIREGEEPILSYDNLDWLDKGLPLNEEGRETIHEDDGATNPRVSRHTSNATQERDIVSHRKVLQVLVVMMVTMGAVGGVVVLMGAVEELVTLVGVLEEMVVLEKMVALVVVMLVK
ncbi:hypothetical protein CK203_108519 [Vitis vinifera]|uniref:Uncharacterized protein n=1 Tax=Vitis vinifera TaxID=29760 RepID=A0A438CF87_VITVI|nr:hypothetical protein CK203_108519 [Vitis vinifera]